MTRESFENDVLYFEDLISICNEYNLDCCDDIIEGGGEIDEWICQELEYFLRDHYWFECIELLEYIPQSCDYYYARNIFDVEEADFGAFKDEVYYAMCECELFEEGSNDEDEYEDEDEDEEDPPFETEEITLAELYR